MRQKKARFERQGAQFLDPANCGSSIRWSVTYSGSGRRYSDVELRDCDRKITWSGFGAEYRSAMRRKLGVAIREMQNCLRALDDMERKHPMRRPKRAPH